MYSEVSCAIVHGIDSYLVRAETDISPGMPLFEMVGFLGNEVKEARERVRTALRNCGYELPIKRITVNISPAHIKKSGSGFDLPVAISILASMEVIRCPELCDMVMIGELGLNGSIYPVNGVLPAVLAASECSKRVCIVPYDNYHEAALVPHITIIPAKHLKDVVEYLNEKTYAPCESSTDEGEDQAKVFDFSMVNGQKMLRRACEVAACGMHNILMVGPPGSGKTLAAKCIPSILAPMNESEQMELAKIYSVSGKFNERKALLDKRPFRSPHHSISSSGLIGGGNIPHPGEVSLAHGGVLFLDELTEFRKDVIEAMRQPMEDGEVTIGRASGSFRYPAKFMLVAAMNPCKCGYYPDLSRCRCTETDIRRYLGRISQPMLDRMDLCVDAPRLNFDDITSKGDNESSSSIRERVLKAREIQKERFADTNIGFNSNIDAAKLDYYCALGSKEAKFMADIYKRLCLTARTYHKLLRVARTIADLCGSESIKISHLQEAVCYRSLDRSDWERGI